MLSRLVLNEPIVVYKNDSGDLVALEDVHTGMRPFRQENGKAMGSAAHITASSLPRTAAVCTFRAWTRRRAISVSKPIRSK